MTSVPDGLPTLSAYGHAKDEGKACVMEYVSVLTGNEWSDRPPCTALPIALLAQQINDMLTDDERPRLVPFIDRLAAAGEWDESFEQPMLQLVRKNTIESYSPKCFTRGILSDALGLIMRQGSDGTAAERGIAFLDAVLTLHERLTGKTVNPISPEALANAKRLIEPKALVVAS